MKSPRVIMILLTYATITYAKSIEKSQENFVIVVNDKDSVKNNSVTPESTTTVSNPQVQASSEQYDIEKINKTLNDIKFMYKFKAEDGRMKYGRDLTNDTSSTPQSYFYSSQHHVPSYTPQESMQVVHNYPYVMQTYKLCPVPVPHQHIPTPVPQTPVFTTHQPYVYPTTIQRPKSYPPKKYSISFVPPSSGYPSVDSVARYSPSNFESSGYKLSEHHGFEKLPNLVETRTSGVINHYNVGNGYHVRESSDAGVVSELVQNEGFRGGKTFGHGNFETVATSAFEPTVMTRHNMPYQDYMNGIEGYYPTETTTPEPLKQVTIYLPDFEPKKDFNSFATAEQATQKFDVTPGPESQFSGQPTTNFDHNLHQAEQVNYNTGEVPPTENKFAAPGNSFQYYSLNNRFNDHPNFRTNGIGQLRAVGIGNAYLGTGHLAGYGPVNNNLRYK